MTRQGSTFPQAPHWNQKAPGQPSAKQKSVGARVIAGVRVGWRKAATAVAAAVTISMGYHVVFGQNGLTAYEHKRQDSRDLEKQSKILNRENEQLRDHISRLQSDPSAIEHQAREELHYTRPGEVIYTLPAPAPGAARK